MSVLSWQVNAFDFVLTPERALWWAAEHTLFIADPHFGKAATYRALGQPVPGGTTASNLAALDRALARFPVKRLVILGDFMHARQAHHPDLLAALRVWRARHERVECVLVRGNHDSRAGDPPADLNFLVVQEPWTIAGLACCHVPPESLPPDARYALAGHVHPVAVMNGRGRDRLRLPCFDLGPQVGILPAFGAFTGGWVVPRLPGHTQAMIAGDTVLARTG